MGKKKPCKFNIFPSIAYNKLLLCKDQRMKDFRTLLVPNLRDQPFFLDIK